QEHLADGPAMHENQRGLLFTRFGVGRKKKLSVDFQAVGGSENHLLRRDQLLRGKVGGVRLRRERGNHAVGGDSALEGTRGMGRVRAEVYDRLSVAQHHGAPFAAPSARELVCMISRDADRPDVAAVDVAAVGIEEYGSAIES